MFLSSDGLAAFLIVAETGNFSKAAKVLHISQSAVSQRIANLESSLATTLFERSYHKLELTTAGETLRTYCLVNKKMENEVIARIANRKNKEKLQGSVRIAAFSSVLRSVVIKALRPLLLANPELQLDAQAAEMHELPKMLRSGKCDFIVIDHEILKPEVATYHLGNEINVLAVPRVKTYPKRFLDHDFSDTFTDQFRKNQKPILSDAPRHYVDDIYGIIDGIEQGLGMGVVSAHLISEKSTIRIVSDLNPLYVPLWLHHLKGEYDTPLQKAIVETLRIHVPERLSVPQNAQQDKR
jgi:DNA-binding transcriptional LysR family regulator